MFADRLNKMCDEVLMEKRGDLSISKFKYRRNKPGEITNSRGHPIPAGRYGPKHNKKPVLLQFGVWRRSNTRKYETNEPLMTGIDIMQMKPKDIITMAGPADENGIPTGEYLGIVMRVDGGKRRYEKFKEVFDGDFAKKVLHGGPPYTVTQSGNVHSHGAWRTYIRTLAHDRSTEQITPDEFVKLAIELKSKNLGDDASYKKILKTIRDREDRRDASDDAGVRPEPIKEPEPGPETQSVEPPEPEEPVDLSMSGEPEISKKDDTEPVTQDKPATPIDEPDLSLEPDKEEEEEPQKKTEFQRPIDEPNLSLEPDKEEEEEDVSRAELYRRINDALRTRMEPNEDGEDENIEEE